MVSSLLLFSFQIGKLILYEARLLCKINGYLLKIKDIALNYEIRVEITGFLLFGVKDDKFFFFLSIQSRFPNKLYVLRKLWSPIIRFKSNDGREEYTNWTSARVQ